VPRLDSLRTPIKIGVLSSSSGFFQEHESAFLQGAIAGISAVNSSGGIAGRPLEPVFYDTQSDPNRYPPLIRKLVLDDGVNCIFGCVSSPSRKASIPAIEKLGAILWYPTQFEGFEYSRNVIYGGGCPNQHIVPLFHFLVASGRRRIALIGSDYCFPRDCLRILQGHAMVDSVDIVNETYLAVDAPESAYFSFVRRCYNERVDAIVSAVIQPGLSRFYRAYHAANGDPSLMPIASVAASEMDIALIGEKYVRGHLAIGPYFESLQTAANDYFRLELRRRYGARCRANMYSESSYNQIQLFARAAQGCNSLEVDALLSTIPDIVLDTPHGEIQIDSGTHCTRSLPKIAVAASGGTYSVLDEQPDACQPDPYLLAYP
jgi:branched-chain amino acid transport system substrate-binding protein